ncbi:MAG: hypothetical protein CL792_00050 [Chloroflexi bacterium]|nr:hypothetical protein [Chloroflexota bacterium]|tara:strand:- start:7466 stop:8224 length:759 start_codon:yes stop_codon:yes gene_type:complete
MMKNSHLLVGAIRHKRSRFINYDFTHGAWYLAVDLDELDKLQSQLWFLSVNHKNVLEFRTTDHLDGSNNPLNCSIRNKLKNLGFNPSDWQIILVTYPRVLGFIFNPVSFYLCYDVNKTLRHVIAEVNNTHGEREIYDFINTSSESQAVFKASATKRMYVSPFIRPEARYDLKVSNTDDLIQISISEWEQDQMTLFANMRLTKTKLNYRTLTKRLLHDPFITFKTLILIGWHVWRIKQRGVTWTKHHPRDSEN